VPLLMKAEWTSRLGMEACGSDDRRENAIGDGEGAEKIAVPVARGWVDHFGGGGFGVLNGFVAAEEVIEEVGNHEQGCGRIELGIAGQDHGIELEESVVGKRLRARGGVEIGF